jgi:hypothetical protein
MRRYWSWRALGTGLAGTSLLAHGTHKMVDALAASNSLESFLTDPPALFGMALVALAALGLWGATLD